jgi:Zn-dependent protease with chaperone function
MITWAWGPFAAALALVWAGPRTLRSVHPRTAVVLGTAISLVAALSTGLVLAIAAELALTEVQAILEVGSTSRWHPSVVALVLGVVAGVLVTGLLASAVTSLVRSVRNLYAAWRDTRDLNPQGKRLVIVDDAVPTAFAVTGYPGQVVVSTAMLEALESDERTALLAHEDAHLRYHHQVYVQLTKLAAAANPLLRPLVDLVQTATERWADEEAAAAIGDRELAARAVARAALASHRHGHRRSPAVSAVEGSASESQLALRINRLMGPPPSAARRVVAGVLLLLALCATTGAMAAVVGHQQVEHIETTVLGSETLSTPRAAV